MPTPESEAGLVRRARQGNKSAFGELVLRYRRPVLAIAYRMTGDAAAAEDVAQEAFVRAWSRLGSLRDVEAFRGWLYRLAVNASVDYLRRKPGLQPLTGLELDRAPLPEGEVLARERADAVRQAILALPEQCRAALILREFEGLAYKEIAHVLGIPLGTVMSRLSNARNLLRGTLGGHAAPPESPTEDR